MARRSVRESRAVSLLPRFEFSAQAVLDTFGPGIAAKALRNVRGLVESAERERIRRGSALDVIDAEIAKLDPCPIPIAEAIRTHEMKPCPSCKGTGDSMYEPNAYCGKCGGEGKLIA